MYIAELENQSDIFPSLTQIQPDSQNLKQNTKISFKLKDKYINYFFLSTEVKKKIKIGKDSNVYYNSSDYLEIPSNLF